MFPSNEDFYLAVLTKYFVTSDGRVFNQKTGNEVRQWLRGEYMTVQIAFGGYYKQIPTHRLVAFKYVNNRKGYPIVNHLNGDKLDNRAANLQWCSYEQNSEHAVMMGLTPSGNSRNDKKLTDEQVSEIRKLHADGMKRRHIADAYGVSRNYVSCIISRRARSVDADAIRDHIEWLKAKKPEAFHMKRQRRNLKPEQN